jgi:hypothetical protein
MSDDKFNIELNTDAFKRVTEQLKLTAEQTAKLADIFKNNIHTVTATLLTEAWGKTAYGNIYPMSIVPSSIETGFIDERSVVLVIDCGNTPVEVRIPMPYRFANKPIGQTVKVIEEGIAHWIGAVATEDWLNPYVRGMAIEVPENFGAIFRTAIIVD